MTHTLTGRYPLGDLTGQAGRLRFTPTTTIVGAGNVVLPAPVVVDLDTDGSFSVALVGTDDADYSPSGWLWTVTELMPGGRAPWSFELTADADIADLTSTTAPEATGGYYPFAEVAADPDAPATDGARLYVRDTGLGKTELVVRFATGAVQVIATQP